ncbi:hypothetical protein [cf. Phormidesmis sp. LEGE 11477]|uniref:hypothetical protein n=1 Tax=cf. Phormidesmis sp. LEGE 11477 TaxID=1828680 RepID=UPI001881E9FA|nr:hypothetical protein [cf. Phormidesmis sp. LEGE 11477]MBE9063953.1 hypothetical protein [cf. Phormidesmis sp. LEGE 11477]
MSNSTGGKSASSRKTSSTKLSPIKRIDDVLFGERIVEMSPPPDNPQELGRRRLNLFEGRRLSHQNLALAQNHIDRHLARLGQQLSPGVIDGLVASFVDEGFDNPLNQRLLISDGSGLSHLGEDVQLPADHEVVVGNLSVYAPPEVLQPPEEAEESEAEESESEESEGEPTEEPIESALRPRRLGGSLQSLVSQDVDLPKVGILLLEPVVVNSASTEPSDDPCQLNIEGLAFANLKKINGVRLSLYTWPEEWLSLPPLATESTDTAGVNRWRSSLAYSIFRRELAEPMPWESFGVPIALLGFDANWKLLFSDRHAVVRQGGRSLHRMLPVPNSGNPFLWQARIEQFAEQLFELDRDRIPVEDLANYFTWLPPAGGLPPDVIENLALPPGGTNGDRIQHFFPTGYRIEAAPIPKDQLDLIFKESASLQPYDTVSNDASNQVKLLVPVEEEYYDPDLLKVEEIDPEFNTTLSRFINDRAAVLHRRQLVRDRASLLNQSITGKLSLYPSPDPDQLEFNEKDIPDSPFDSQSAHQSSLSRGIHEHGFNVSSTGDTLTLQAGDRLLTYVYLDVDNPPAQLMLTFRLGKNSEHRAYWGPVSSRIERGIPGTASLYRVGNLPVADEWIRLEVPMDAVGLNPGNVLTGMTFSLFNGRAAWGHTARLANDGSEDTWLGTELPNSATVLPTGETSEPWLWLTAEERLTPFEQRYGIEQESAVDKNNNPITTKVITPIEVLKADLRASSPIDLDAVRIVEPKSDDDKDGLTAILSLIPSESPVTGNVRARSLTIRGVLSAADRDALTAYSNSTQEGLGDVSAAVRNIFRDAIAELFTQSQDNTLLESITEQGLAPFIRELEQRSSEANDTVEFGFLQVRTDMFRVRQFVLGEEEASRLSVSPTLGAIAKQASASGSQEALNSFFEKIKADTILKSPNELVIQPPTSFEPVKISSAPRGLESELSFIEARVRTPRTSSTRPPRSTLSAAGLPGSQAASTDTLFRSGVASTGSQPQRFDLSSNINRIIGSGTSTSFIEARPINNIITSDAQFFTTDRAVRAIDKSDLLAATVSLRDANQLPRATDTSTQKLFFGKTSKAVVNQSPIVGKVNPSITIAERLKEPPAPETRNYTLAGRVSVFSGIANNAIFKDLSLPGKFQGTFGQLKQRPDRFEANPKDLSESPDEAEYFSSSVRVLDDTVAALRLAERRLVDYGDAIARAETTLNQLQALRQQANSRLSVLEDDLAVTRHDVSVTRSLLAEEQQRIDAINQRRRSILENQVDFVFYHRPRSLGPDIDVPMRDLLPGVQFPARPTCLRYPVRLPEALKEASELLRQSPINWFPETRVKTKQFNRPEPLLKAIDQSVIAAKTKAVQPSTPALNRFSLQSASYASAISRTVVSQRRVVEQYRVDRTQVEPSRLAAVSWQSLIQRAYFILTLGDLIDNNSGELSRSASREFTYLTRALGCLYSQFSQVRPVIRLAWAERLSQYDNPVSLRNFGNLPRWGEIDYLARKEMQSVADWLYSRVSDDFADTIALVNDLVRICILLASAAPVDQIIAGRVESPTPASKGSSVNITINPAQVAIGMEVSFYDKSNIAVATGIVEDMISNRAAARITATYTQTVQLAANTRARFQSAVDFSDLEVLL